MFLKAALFNNQALVKALGTATAAALSSALLSKDALFAWLGHSKEEFLGIWGWDVLKSGSEVGAPLSIQNVLCVLITGTIRKTSATLWIYDVHFPLSCDLIDNEWNLLVLLSQLTFIICVCSLSSDYWTYGSLAWVTMRSRGFHLRWPTSCSWWNWTSPETVHKYIHIEEGSEIWSQVVLE